MEIMRRLSGTSPARAAEELARDLVERSSVGSSSSEPGGSAASIPIRDLLADCESFTQLVKRQVFGAPRRFSLSLFLSPEVPQESLSEIYSALMGKVEDAEAKLRERVLELTDKKSALRDQALHLKERVDSCLHSCHAAMENNERDSDVFRALVARLSDRTTAYKGRLAFNESVMKQKKMEDFKRGRVFEGWPPTEAQNKASSGAAGDGGDGCGRGGGGGGGGDDDDLKNASAVGLAGHTIPSINAESNMMHITRAEFDGDRDHVGAEKLVGQLRDVRDKAMARLGVLLEVRETATATSDSSQLARNRICDLLTYHGDLYEDAAAASETSFDHTLCHDCGSVTNLTYDCAEHYERVSKQTIEVSRRLSMVVEIRERVKDIWVRQLERRQAAQDKKVEEADAGLGERGGA